MLSTFDQRTQDMRYAAHCVIRDFPGTAWAARADLTLAICDFRDALSPFQQRLFRVLTWLERRLP